MKNYEADLGLFRKHETHILSLSVDSVPAKAAWAESLGDLAFDLLSDFDPQGVVAKAYGVAREAISPNEPSLSWTSMVRS